MVNDIYFPLTLNLYRNCKLFKGIKLQYRKIRTSTNQIFKEPLKSRMDKMRLDRDKNGERKKIKAQVKSNDIGS